jgi:gluconolactonase
MPIVRDSCQLDALIPRNAEIVKLATGFSFAEGPVWCGRRKRLYFTDFPLQRLYSWSQAEGVRLLTDKSGRAVGLALDAEGRMIVCESLARRISRIEADGTFTALATHYGGRRLNNTNDVVVRRNGTIYFTDPYSAMLGLPRELDLNGVYMCDPATREVTLLVGDFERPNGLAFSPDESLLYINDTARQHVRVFEVAADGTLRPGGRLFAELDTSAGPGAADGMKTDARGNVYVAGPGGVSIFAPSGERLGRIELPEVVANLAFGGSSGSEANDTLYMTATSSLYAIKLSVCGAV